MSYDYHPCSCGCTDIVLWMTDQPETDTSPGYTGYIVRCERCELTTARCNTEEEAVALWNKSREEDQLAFYKRLASGLLHCAYAEDCGEHGGCPILKECSDPSKDRNAMAADAILDLLNRLSEGGGK